MRFLSPEEPQIMKNLNPHLFGQRALGIIYLKESPELEGATPASRISKLSQ